MEPRKSFLLRINPGLWRDIESWAQAEFRSVNGQIEYLLSEAVRRRQGVAPLTTVDEPPMPSGEGGSEEPPEAPELEMGRHD